MLPIFILSTSRGRVVKTKTQPLNPTAKALQYPFYRRVGGPQRQSGGEQRGENLFSPPGLKTGTSSPQQVTTGIAMRLKSILKKSEGRTLTHFMWLGRGQSVGSSEHSDEPSGSIKCGELLDQLRNQQLLKRSSAQMLVMNAISSFHMLCVMKMSLKTGHLCHNQ